MKRLTRWVFPALIGCMIIAATWGIAFLSEVERHEAEEFSEAMNEKMVGMEVSILGDTLKITDYQEGVFIIGKDLVVHKNSIKEFLIRQ